MQNFFDEIKDIQEWDLEKIKNKIHAIFQSNKSWYSLFFYPSHFLH